MAGSLRVIARLVAKSGRAEELKELLGGLIAPTRAEQGCIMYVLLRNKEKPEEFTFVEEWTDEAALARHLATPHLQHAISRFDDLLGEPLWLGKYDLVA